MPPVVFVPGHAKKGNDETHTDARLPLPTTGQTQTRSVSNQNQLSGRSNPRSSDDLFVGWSDDGINWEESIAIRLLFDSVNMSLGT